MASANVELVRRLYELWDNRDYGGSVEFIDPDVVFVRTGEEFADLSGEWRGLDEFWAAVAEYLQVWEDLRQETERFIDLGDRVLVLVKQVGRGRGSGATVERDVAFLFTLRGGIVTRIEGYWDRAEALRVAGFPG